MEVSNIIDANGNNICPSFIIKVTLKLGTPSLFVESEFLVVKDLPFSCIIGQNILSKFSKWSVCNATNMIEFNHSHTIFYSNPNYINCDSLNLITINKTMLEPYKTVSVSVRACGTSLSPFRATTNITVMTDGNDKLSNRLNIEILPAINVLSHQDFPTQLFVRNCSPQSRTIKKGINIGTCFEEFEVYDITDYLSVHSIKSEVDILNVLKQKIEHLPQSQFNEALGLLSNYQDIFSLSNAHIGRTNSAEFDIDTSQINPVSVPLRRVPIHYHEIVQELIDKYEELGLVEPIDSPYRAATVLVKRKIYQIVQMSQINIDCVQIIELLIILYPLQAGQRRLSRNV